MRRPYVVKACYLTLLLPIALQLSACGDDPAQTCTIESLEAQQHNRFPAGSTYWLPTPGEDCEGATWRVSLAPGDNNAQVVEGADGQPRFSPSATGGYTIELGSTGHSVELQVIPGTEVPFQHYAYYPSRSQVLVGGELWVANAYSPTVSRLDAQSLANLGTIAVGPSPVALAHRAGMDVVVVANRAGDTVGFIEVESGELVDALWVGDEPSNLLLSADGSVVWVSLATESAIVEVDIAAREVARRFEVEAEPFGMAVSPDGRTLYTATQRSGQPSRFPFGVDPIEEERDITVVDLDSGEVDRWWLDVGTTINGLLADPDGEAVYVLASWTDNQANFTDVDEPNFAHRVLRLDAITGDVLVEADLWRQPSSLGHAVTLHGLALADDALWVAAEASNLAVALDPKTLEERSRTEVQGRPRDVLVGADGSVYVHGSQGFSVTRLSSDGQIQGTGNTVADPRPAEVAIGQAYFTGAGRGYAANWGCDSCHGEARTDQVVWRAGPFETAREVTRPLFWLEGTRPLGWTGYVKSARNFAFATNTNIGIRPNTQEAETLTAFLRSLMPPPAANGWTQRDGSHSELGLRGKELYEGKAGCIGCHALPLTTSRAQLPVGVTEGAADIPALVGVYRHNTWMKHGEASSLRGAVELVLAWSGVNLSSEEVGYLTRYVQELTGREFFALAIEPTQGSRKAPVNGPIKVIFSMPVWDDAENLRAIWLEDEDGEQVELTRALDGRYVWLQPSAPLAHGVDYTVVIGEGFEAFNERVTGPEARLGFTTAAAPSIALDGEYVWTIDLPLPNFAENTFDNSTTVQISARWIATSTASGADLIVDYDNDLVYATPAVIEGNQLNVEQILIAVTTSFADTEGLVVELIDEDNDGVADSAAGTLTMVGPGFSVPDVTFTLSRPSDGPAPTCTPGAAGDFDLTLSFAGETPVIDWDADTLGNSLGFYVTDPGATLPLGPGTTVSNGEAYWALAAENFPAGFAGPVTYGQVPAGATDDSATHGAPVGGAALEAGRCYQFSVITNMFQTATYTLIYGE